MENEFLEYDEVENEVLETEQSDSINPDISESTGDGNTDNGLSDGLESYDILQSDESITESEVDPEGQNFDISQLVQNLLESQSNTELEEVTYTIWDKPFEEYTPSEGYLLLIFILLLWLVVSRQIGGVFK